MLRRLIMIMATIAAVCPAAASEVQEHHLVFVMVDGVRWQEVFRGAELAIADDPDMMKSYWASAVRERFVQTPQRQHALVPFLADVVAKRGVLLGNRDQGGCAKVVNPYWISYPGYAEAINGRVDSAIDSNELGDNPDTSFLEWLHARAERGSVQVVGSWDKMRQIVAADRKRIPINTGLVPSGSEGPAMTMADRLIRDTPTPWPNNRLDSFTHVIALETLRTRRPATLFIQYAQPDNYAHQGEYAQYLLAIHRTDQFLRELWATLQADPHYAGTTTLIVAPDHGRGTGIEWRDHGASIKGADEIWIGAIGPDITAAHEPKGCATLSQIAATALTALGDDWRAFNPAAAPPLDIFRIEARK